MENNSILAKEIFTLSDQALIDKYKPSILVCNECLIPGIDAKLQVLRTDAFRVEGSWVTYRHNQDTVENLRRKKGRLFNCVGHDISPAVSKMTYWSNYKAGAVKACLEQFKGKQFHIKDFTSFSASTLFKNLTKSCWLILRSTLQSFKRRPLVSFPKFNSARIGVLIKEDLELALYRQLLGELARQEVIVFHYGNLSKELMDSIEPSIQFVNIAAIKTFERAPFYIPFFLNNDELHVCNLISGSWSEIATEIKRYQFMMRTGIKCLLINEGENLPYRNLLKVVFGTHVKVCNTMNGIKSGEAQDADVNFDTWFVWDEKMKDLFVKKCKLPESMLVNVGHLAQDFKANHKFENRLGLDLIKLSDKVVITVFSVRGNRKEKMDVEEILLNRMKTNENVFVVYKPHPLEKKSDYLFKSTVSNRVVIVPESYKNSKEALYDLLSTSDLSIVFGSTVALESSWFETPCLTIEYRDDSIVYGTDGKDIVHISNKQMLEKAILSIGKKEVTDPKKDGESVSKKIAEHVLKYELAKNSYLWTDNMNLNGRIIYAQDLLTRDKYLAAKQKGANLFLFNEIDFLYDENSEDEFYNCTQGRVQSTWLSWRENERIIEHLKSKCPELFELAGYDITLSVKKAMFWENIKRGFLHYAYDAHFKGCQVIELPKLHPVNRLKAALRYAKLFVHGKQKLKPVNHAIQPNPLKTIHVKNDFQVGLYQRIFEDLKNERNYQVLIDPRIDKGLLDVFDLENAKVLYPQYGLLPIPKVNFLKFNREDWFVFNIILLHWEEISQNLQLGLEILENNPKVLLINEGENGIYGAMLSEVMNKHKVPVFNTMNGIKSGESQDTYVNFDKWFIWDNQMKHLLMEKNHLPEDKLIVSGHLMEDMVKNYSYNNSLNLDLESIKNKKVISVFSVRGKRLAKMETLEYLFKLISESDKYFLILRPHPSEKREDYFLPESVNTNNFLFVEYGRHEIKDTLHDQLFLTDVSIVFGSTVALDSKWMNVPCITYEIRDESLVYCIDNDWIYHVRNLEELKLRLFDLLDKNLEKNEPSGSSVSKRIIHTLNSYAE